MKKNYNSFFCSYLKFFLLSFKGSQYLSFAVIFFFFLKTTFSFAQFPTEFAKVELASGLSNTTSFEFAPDGRIFILDRYGEILIYDSTLGFVQSAGTINVFHDQEDGLLAIEFDPNFDTNNFVYMYYSPEGVAEISRVSRFTMTGGSTLDNSSEQILLEWDTDRSSKYHSGGDMAFDSNGNLYISTGDNTTYPDTYTAIALQNTDTPTNRDHSAEKSSSDTNDYMGKILRITPQANGTYTSPAGNLFPGGAGGLPEIYIMGVRNPYRIFVDKDRNDWLFWGEVGPDASVASARGPIGMDELNIATQSGNYGWPYFSGNDNLPYQVVYNGSPPFYNDPLAPVNTSVFNTGASTLPPAEPSVLSFGGFFKCVLSGFRYDYDSALTDQQRLPIEFDDAYFFFDFNQSRIYLVNLDANGDVVQNLGSETSFANVPQFAPSTFPASTEGFIDMEVGPDGKMYILAYGVPCCSSDAGPSGKLYRVDYTGITNNSPPVVQLTATPTNGDLPLTVEFSTAGTTDPNGDSPLTYEWDFDSNGTIDSTDPSPTHIYTTAGTYNAQVRVSDGNPNGISTKNETIFAGNNLATFTINSPAIGGLFNWGDDLNIDIDVEDEALPVNCNNVIMVPGFGHLNHVHPEISTNTCPQLLRVEADDNHGIDGELDIFGSISLEYTDGGGLISRDLITLHPKRKEAEFFSTQSGTTIIPNNDPLEGGLSALRVNNGSFISLDGRNLQNINAVKYRVAATNSGGTIELRVGSTTGPILATTNVPVTGGSGSWAYVESPITDPGGMNDLFFVFNGSGSNIFDLDYIEFIGDGVSTDNTPPIVERVSVVNATTVAVKFSEYLNESSAETLANYAIDNGISISSAVLQVDDRTVYLTTTQLNSGISYLLTVQNVENTSSLGISSDTYPFSVLAGVRINAGGSELVAGGETFIADNFNAGGSTFSTTEAIEGTTDDELYQTERFGAAGTFGYEIPVGSSGEYDIRLHFAEIFYGLSGAGSTGGPGSRVFNVSIEGSQVLTNFDILSEVAPATALIKEFDNVIINDGAASIQFTGITESPKVSAIEVLDPNTFSGSNNDADITITSPSDGWDVNQPFEVAFRVENWTILEGDTHVHYFIDDVMVGPHYSYEPIPIDGLGLGQHTIKIELYEANHMGIGVFDEVTVNVTGSITCNTTPFPDQWGVKQLETSSLPHVSVYTFADFDLDGDGLKDIVTGAWWYKNPGTIQGNWVRSTIGNTFNNVAYVHDFDEDGDLDLLGTTGAYQGVELVWAQNDGAGNFTVFSNIPSGNSTYSEPFLAGIAGGVFEIGGPFQMAINWNGAETGTGSPVELLTPSADPTTGTWSLVTLSNDSTGEDIQAGDIDQDNDLDLFQGSNWLRNDLSSGGGWTTFSTGITYATTPDRAQLADFDRDGDLDAVVGQLSAFTSDPDAGEFSWFAAPADPTQPWVRNILDTDVNGSLSVFATDIDFDGDKDIVVGEWIGDYRLLAFENNLCVDGTFTKRVLNSGIPGQEHHDGARVTDLDNDGDLDVVSNGWFVGGQIRNFPRIYENQTVPVEDDEPIVDAGPDQNVLPGNVTLNGSASDPDGGAIASYEWTQVSGPSTATLTGDTTETLLASGLVQGVYIFRLTATDDESDTGFDDATITVSNQALAIRINSGGPTYTFNTTTWSEDQYFSAGTIVENAIAIANTNNDQLYQTERFHTGDLIYEIPVSNGEHNVNLHFAEIFYGVPGPGSSGGIGSRVFNVDIEGGEGTLTNYDIIAAAGASATAIVENFTNITVNDGSLTITLTGVTEFPKISGIEVVVAGSSDAPIVFAGDDRSITLPNNSLTLDGSATDPDGGMIVSYIWTQVSGPSNATFSSMIIADPNISDLVEGDYIFSLTAVDDEGDMGSDEVTITVASEPSSLLINSGGPSFTFNVEEWTIDQYFVGGSIFEDAIAIANTDNDQLYQTERFSTSGTLVYEIPVINGSYNVDLHFAELFYGVGGQSGGIGSRIFNIQVENQPQIANYDIVDAAGGSATAVIESLTNVPVTDGMLTITLTSITEFPKISGIGVYETRPPDVDAGADQTIILPTNSIILNGTGSDPDGGMITYQWTQESGPGTATLTGADTANLTASDLIEGEYVFRLSVTDDEGETAFDDVTITVLPEGGMNDIMVNAGEDITITLPDNTVTINGFGSSTVGDVEFIWTQENGPSTATLSGENTADLTVNDLVVGVYTFRLTVTDSESETAFDEVTVTVLPEGGMSDAPVAVAEATPISGAPRLLVTFTGSNSTDNTGIVTYLWDFGDGTTSTEADLEKIYEVAGTYEVTLTVTDDGGLTDMATLTITVVDDPTSEMDIILQSNPPNPADGGFAHVQIINQPADVRVMNITLHDVGGRYLGGYLAEEIEQNGVYRIPVATLGDGIYFVRVAMSEGKTTLIKLWIRN